MAEIASFRGYRFNKLIAGDLNKIMAQPYDQIDETLRLTYFERSEYNVARITKDVPRPTDTPNDNQYTRAATCWEGWMEKRVLVRENGPAIYPYFQQYQVEGRTFVRKGLIALVSLDDKNAKVRAHEHTLSGPKADRLKLMKATEANDGQIFMLYQDPEQKINAIIDQELLGVDPSVTVKDDFGATHRLYKITRPGAVLDIAELFQDLELFIADGHHRYETAVNYMNYCKSRNWKPVSAVPAESFTHRMMTMVNMYDPGLQVLPTHRLLHSLTGFNPEDFLKKAGANFEVQAFSDRPSLFAAMDEAFAGERTAFGLAAGGMNGFRMLTLKNPSVLDSLLDEPHCDAWKKLDVAILHTVLLDKILGITKEKLAAESNIQYIRYRDAALDKLGHGGVQAVFLMNPTRVEQVREVALAGERMPQKSTDFFPKLLTGMVMMKMQIDKSMGLAVYEAE